MESNLLHNDEVTNQQSFEHITQEYMHMLGKLQENDKYNTEDQASSNSPLRRKHRKKRSYHNNIPIISQKSHSLRSSHRCRTFSIIQTLLTSKDDFYIQFEIKANEVYINHQSHYLQEKSRYRLSSIYNINPIAYEESTMETSVATSSTSSGEHTITSDSHEVDH